MSAPHHNLPPPADEFIGRERDIADLRRIVGATRMVSLTGIGGIGKTRLAVHVARQSLSRFPDGIRFIDLSEVTSSDQVIRVIARSLRVLGNSGEASVDAIAAVLRSRRMLLLPDTCERAAAPLADLCQTLLASCPGVHILATSRQPLRIPEETVWRVPPLSFPPRAVRTGRCPAPDPLTPDRALDYEAVRLFSARARTARPGSEMTSENSGDIAEVCRILDGVPLAIELAAARVRVLSVQQILHRLDDRFRLLVTTGQELPPRQRTLRAVLEWSHDLLTHPEQILLRRLAVFGTWDLEQAEYVCGHTGIDREEIQELLFALLDKSLIVIDAEVDGAVRYRLPDTVRAYAAERLAAAEEEEPTWERCLEEAVARSENMAAAVSAALPWPERLRYLQHLDHAQENTARLLTWALEHGHVEAGLRMCVALRPYWFARGLATEGAHHLALLLDAAESAVPTARAVRARALAVHAELCLDTEGAHTSRRLAHVALEASRACDDRGSRAIALGVLAAAALRTCDDAESRYYADQALTAAREVPDHFTEVAALSTLGRLARRTGDDDAAAGLMARSIKVAEDIGDRWCAARCLNGMGALSTQRGDLESAERQLSAALHVFSEMGSAPEAARCTSSMGYLDLARGDISGARRRFSGCLRISMASGRRGAIARSLDALAELALAERQSERAASLAGAAARLYAGLGQPAPHSESLRSRAGLGLAFDATEKAWQAWRALPLEQVVDKALSFPATRHALPSLLTPREKEVAALVGEGMSNRQVAERLVISQATAARHIANIFRKLLITSRTQLADWSQKHGLGTSALISEPTRKTGQRQRNR